MGNQPVKSSVTGEVLKKVTVEGITFAELFRSEWPGITIYTHLFEKNAYVALSIWAENEKQPEILPPDLRFPIISEDDNILDISRIIVYESLPVVWYALYQAIFYGANLEIAFEFIQQNHKVLDVRRPRDDEKETLKALLEKAGTSDDRSSLYDVHPEVMNFLKE